MATGFWQGASQGYDKGSTLGAQMYRDVMEQKEKERANAAAMERQGLMDQRYDSERLNKDYQFEREMQMKEKQLNQKPGAALPQGLKLKPGEVWDPATQSVKAVFGSDLYKNQSGKHATDFQAMRSTEDKASSGVQAIDEFLNRKGGVESQFGKGFSGLATRYMDPGAGKQLEQIKSTIRSAGLDMMRQGGSIGTMTEREWPMVENMMAALDNTLNEEDARFQLEKIKTKLGAIQSRAKETYQTEWGGSQFAPQGQAPMQDERAEYEALKAKAGLK